MKEKALIISPHFTVFIKEQTEEIAKYLEEVNVLIHHNYLAELALCIPFQYLRHVMKFSKRNLADLKTTPENIKVHLVSTIYFIPDGRNLRLGDKLFVIFEKFITKSNLEFELIHAHFSYPQGYVGVKLANKYSIPIVVTAHGHDIYDMPFRSKKWFDKIKYVLDNADIIITPSKSNRNIMIDDLNVNPEKIFIVPNGFNQELFKPRNKFEVRKQLGLPYDKKIILNVARLDKIKGHKCLIDAIKLLTKSKKNVLCIIIGDGPLKKELEEYVKRLNLEGYIKLIGEKPHEEISLWMNAADIFVLSSINEGNPTVMFEALGVGLPFIGTNVGGIPDIIISDNYGFLVSPGNPYELAEKIEIALSKQWDRQRIVKYSQQFTWETIAKKIIKIYKKVLEESQ